MPLLRGKPFRPKAPPKELKKENEVFFHELTGEVFTDYDEFFERVILCNSLLWTCECTGHNGLTYKEASESEESVRKALATIPFATKQAVLSLVHHTKRSRIADLCEEIIDYLKKRYQEGEIVEVKVKDQWKKAKVEKVITKNKVTSPTTTPKKPTSQSTPGKGTPGKKTTKKNQDDHSANAPLSPGGRKLSLGTEPNEFEYEVKLMKSDGASSLMKFQDKNIRRIKGSLTRELVRLLLRQTCKRTTMSSDDGYWVVEPNFVEKYSLGQSSIGSGPLSLETPLKLKNKRKRSSGISEGEASPAKKRKSSDSGNAPSPSKEKKTKKLKDKEKTRKKSIDNCKDAGSKSPAKKSKSEEKVKELTPGQKKKLLEKKKLKEIADKEKLKKKKLLEREKERERLKKEKEEEKIKRKVEKEKEKERTTEIRKLEAEFMKEWIKIRDDLKLEDLKELPQPVSIPTKIQGELFGDAIMVVEFLNIFGTFYDIQDALQQEITYELIEKAVHEHDAEGTFYDIIKFLLQTFLSVAKEENEEEANDDESSNGTATPDEPEAEQEQEEEKQHGHVSSNATAAAAWPMLHQGMALDELTIDPFTLSEILRLHILSSGVRIGGQRNMWQRKGGFQFSDDPCVDFRHREKSILATLHTGCLYDLSVQDKLKLLCVLCNQILTLTTTRDYIEDSFEKVKELKKKLRELQNAEHKRRKLDSAERWRKRMEESARRREEIEKRKKEKEAREGESQNKKEREATDGESSQANTQEEKDETVVEKKKRGRKPKHTESKPEQAESSQSQDSKVDRDVEMVADSETKKEEQTQEEKEAELRKREQFKNEEKELIEEIVKHSSIRSEAPLGLDRIYNRYWSFRYVDGLLIEADDVGRKLAKYVVDEDDDELEVDLADDGISKGDVDSVADSTDGKEQEQHNKEDFPKVSLTDIIDLRNSGKAVTDQLLLRYRCRVNEERLCYVSQSKLISTALDAVQKGIDPRFYADKPVQLWSAYNARGQLDALVDGMNIRGTREMNLKTKLEKTMDSLYNGIDNCKLLSIETVEDRPAKVRPPKGDVIDKSLFRNIEDFLEANLRDQLLDFEERLWQASLGIIKIENREEWREGIANKINDLLWGKDGMPVNAELNARPESQVGELKKEDGAVENGVGTHDRDTAEDNMAMAVDQVTDDVDRNASAGRIKQSQESVLNGEVKLGTADLTNIPKGSFKTLPLKLFEQNTVKEETSRCHTPVNVATPMLNVRVKELALTLLEIEKGIDQKYLKPPLGEDEETKKERIREMIEAAHVEFHGKIDKSKRDSSGSKKKQISNKPEADKNGEQTGMDDDVKSVTSDASDEALKKEITCLERWESSLNAATNFSQIFIHLNTLDRSVMWDKSVLNARCRLCRKKGDAEKMLLCDGCDRGFHMYCLKPPVKKIPVGDWFCVDCRPKEPKRAQRVRKRPSKLEEYVDDVVESQSSDESEEEEAEENDSDDHESEEEESDEEPMDVHDDFCSVCEELGDLLCCDICSRAFHVGCVYPPIRKVPRGDWSCQVCTGADSDLPKARRVQTIEREREKRIKNEAKANQGKKAKPTRKSADPPKPATRDKKRHSSPGPGASKRQKAESSKQEKNKASRTGVSSRRSIGDPTAYSSRRKSDTFGRYERRLCSKVLEELINADDGEPFLLPVDVRVERRISDFLKIRFLLNEAMDPISVVVLIKNCVELLYDCKCRVPDYLDFIDNPMDLSTMKCKLNKGSYDTLEQFLADVRLIFSNCETYNPPRSGVARAGSRLSIYFEQRLRELELVKM